MQRIQTFGAYDLVERIGFGAMGEVFRAVSRQSGHTVALKRLMPFVSTDADVISALEGEAALARALDHPGVAKVLDFGEIQGVHFIAYEYVHGRDLRAIRERAAKQGETPPLEVVLHVAVRLASALHHAHGRRDASGRPLGLVHRDVCPSNVLVSFGGDVKLADFGIARAEGRMAKTVAGQVKGTIGYMSPEQVLGHPIDGRSDIYALGVIIWELATGVRLFDDAPALVLMERIASGQVHSPRSKNPSLSLALEALVLKSLAQSPDRRYATAAELETDLLQLIRTEGRTTDPARVARYVRSLFPEAAADSAASQEWLNMADSKGGSDLDVFEGLAKKPKTAAPGLTPPPPSARQRTLVGGLVGGTPPLPPPGSSNAPLPPPSMPKPSMPAGGPPPPTSTMPGAAAAPATPSAAPLPPPMPPPPGGRTASGSLPPVSAPPPKLGGGTLAMPPPTNARSSASAALPPPSMPPPKTPLPPAPGNTPAAASIGTAVGLPADGKAAGADTKSVDMDWDDEEESTHVYDKQTHDVMPKLRPAAGAPPPAAAAPAAPPAASAPPKVNAAAALLASSGTAAAAAKSAAPPAPTPPPALGGTMPLPSLPTPLPAPPPVAPAPGRGEDTAVRARPTPAPAPVMQAAQSSGGSKAGLIMGLIALLAVAGLAAFMFIPRSGQFKIDIKSKSGAPIAKAEIFIDGVKKCDTAPCVVTELPPGPKTIKVISGDVQAGDPVTETVEAGKEKLVFITIDDGVAGQQATSTVSPTTGGGTGIKAQSAQAGVKVSVDGTDKGPLPVELKDLAPGTHKLKFEGDKLEALEQTVEVTAGQMKDLGAIKLKVLKGTLKIELATPAAAVTLQGQGPRKERKSLDSVLKLGQSVMVQDIDASQSYKLIASKKGFRGFVQDISFDDGVVEKSIRIELFEEGATAAVEPKDPKEPPGKEPPAAAGGSGTLNINSIPVSKVILDGRPLGSTPKVGVSVPAGNHSVTFIHPELGKKSVSVTVKAGETKTAAVKFK